MKKCPFCAELIEDEAIKCFYCKEFIGKIGPVRNKNTTSGSGGKRALLISFMAVFVIGSIFLFPRKYHDSRSVDFVMPQKASESAPVPAAKPAELSKIDVYLKAYPDYYGLTSGDEASQGKYWYKNPQVYPKKIFYFDTLEQLDKQKLQFTTGQDKTN